MEVAMALSEELKDRAERLAREVITRVERHRGKHLSDLVLQVPPGVPSTEFRDAFVGSLSDGGVELVDVLLEPNPDCGVRCLRFEAR
jgi:hypothetical protein